MKRAPSIISQLLLLAGVASLLLAGFIAVHPAAHAWLHPEACSHCHDHDYDADEAAHECAATLLAAGLMDAAAAPLPAVEFAGCEVPLVLPSLVWVVATFPDRFPPGRAPPSSALPHDSLL